MNGLAGNNHATDSAQFGFFLAFADGPRTIDAMLSFTCPTCNSILQVSLSSAGQKCYCPSCSQKLLIPSPPATLNKTLLGQLPIVTPEEIRVEIVSDYPRAQPPPLTAACIEDDEPLEDEPKQKRMSPKKGKPVGLLAIAAWVFVPLLIAIAVITVAAVYLPKDEPQQNLGPQPNARCPLCGHSFFLPYAPNANAELFRNARCPACHQIGANKMFR